MLELERRRILPAFALTFYKALAAVADPEVVPDPLAWVGSDVLLLAPYQVDATHWGGFLIADAEAAGQVRELRSESGALLRFEIPASVAASGAVAAEAGIILPIAAVLP